MIKRMGKFDWCAVIEKQWCNLWKRQNVLPLQACPVGIDIPILCIAAKHTNHYAVTTSTSICQSAVFKSNQCEKFSRNFSFLKTKITVT